MGNPFISLRKVNKYAGTSENRVHILQDIDLEIACGEFVAIIGHSGSGKSTLLNIIGGLDSYSTGAYQICGIPIEDLSSSQISNLRNRLFGFVFQKYNLLNSLTALDNVILPAIYSGTSPETRRQRAQQILSQLGLEKKLLNYPLELSGGQQQRVSIARALMNGGQVVFADEPTGALDTKSGEAVMEILRTLHQQGHTIVLVTHNPEIANQAPRVVEIQDGKILSDTSKEPLPPSPPTFPEIPASSLEVSDVFFESLRMALSSIKSHKMRSLLTMLGIIIGIAAVALVFALGKGSQEKILADISAIGTNTIEIFPGRDFGDLEAWRITTLSIQDAESLRKLSFVDAVSPKINGQATAFKNSSAVKCSLYGVSNEFSSARGLRIKHGAFFAVGNIFNIDSVIVLDENTYNSLFPSQINPLGQIVFLNKHPFKIIGVLNKINSPFNDTSTPIIYIPYTTMMYKMSGAKNIDSIIVRVSNDINAQAAEKNIINFLTNRHGGVKDFFMLNTDSIKQTIERTTTTMTILISGVALISLAVGGIGVMNIMLVSVTERTSEIGLRMAVGARKRDILIQFLIESVVICLLGGFIGVLFSLILEPIINLAITNFRLSSSPINLLLAIGCSSFIGIVFGFIPARNASLLTPIEALGRK